MDQLLLGCKMLGVKDIVERGTLRCRTLCVEVTIADSAQGVMGVGFT